MKCCFECHESMVARFGSTRCTHVQGRLAAEALAVMDSGERHLGLEAPQIVLPTSTSSSASIAY